MALWVVSGHAAASGTGHCPAAVACACRLSLPGKRRNRPLQCMAVDFVCCPAAAGGTGHCPAAAVSGSGHCPAEPLSRLWRQLPFQESLTAPNVPPLKGEVPAARAARFSNAESGSFNLWLPDSSIGCAAASACRLSLPAASGIGPADRKESGKSNLCFPDSCQYRRQQVGAGTACTESSAGEESGGSNLWPTDSSIEPAAATGTGHCPAKNPGP